uniref:Uncharacterized protein n=1 Tax=Anguilla anguilla TaxID=7936 RepID=A0A0E9STW8_ANGAN
MMKNSHFASPRWVPNGLVGTLWKAVYFYNIYSILTHIFNAGINNISK